MTVALERPKTYSGNRASQLTDEIMPLIGFARMWGVSSYLEIGSRHGDTFHLVTSSLGPGAKALAVDMPGGLWGISSSMQALERAVDNLKRNGNPDAACMFGDSQSEETAARVNSWRAKHVGAGKPFDLALIDGDHRLPGVTRDWELYSPLARYVCFHDIVGVGQIERAHGNPVEVPLLWEKIKVRAPWAVHEFIAPGSPMGIGLVDTAKFYGKETFEKFEAALT